MNMYLIHTFTTYTKHYYISTPLSTSIGSERINSKLGTLNSLGVLCEQMAGYDLVNEMNTRVDEAGKRLNNLYQDLDKELEIEAPYLYSESHRLVCGFKSHNPKLYDAYWYHPDHTSTALSTGLGSSSFITNTTGEINQHMEYLPFGETLVEEHLNSYNSPFKFNAKEYDAETGNYYYGARYYDPKWSAFLTPDPALESYPGISPYAYTLNNPVRYVDPTGMFVEDPPSERGSVFGDIYTDPDNNEKYKWDGLLWIGDQGNNTGVLEEVSLNTSKAKGVQNGVPLWGNGTKDLGHKNGTRRGSIDINDLSLSTAGGGKTTIFLQFIRYMLEGLGISYSMYSKVEKMKSSESRMVKEKKGLVKSPKEQLFTLFIHQSFSDGRYSGGATKNLLTPKNLKETKIDSALIMERGYAPGATRRKIDSVTSHKK